jgi:hypothetical protein
VDRFCHPCGVILEAELAIGGVLGGQPVYLDFEEQ